MLALGTDSFPGIDRVVGFPQLGGVGGQWCRAPTPKDTSPAELRFAELLFAEPLIAVVARNLQTLQIRRSLLYRLGPDRKPVVCMAMTASCHVVLGSSVVVKVSYHE